VKDPLPLTRDEIQGDPRIVQGTGSAPYNAPQLQPINEASPDKLNLSKMYNLKDLHDKKIRGNASG